MSVIQFKEARLTFETIMISLIVDGEERLKLIEGCPKDESVARTVMIYPRLL